MQRTEGWTLGKILAAVLTSQKYELLTANCPECDNDIKATHFPDITPDYDYTCTCGHKFVEGDFMKELVDGEGLWSG